MAMETKRQLVRPTPAIVRAKLPRLSKNPDTQQPASDWKMMSPKSKYKGPNTRAAKTVKSQGRKEQKVHWTLVFALGKACIYVCNAEAARRDPRLPARLNEGAELAKFIRNVLPGILPGMRDEYGWGKTPRTVVHDKALYFVTPKRQCLANSFAEALRDAKIA